MRTLSFFLFSLATVSAEVLFTENFDALENELTAWISDTESGGDATDWTKTAPAGWSQNDEGVPEGGVEEFAGWTFLDPVSWNATAQQGRSSFTKGSGVIAVADGDEWDDAGPGARMETSLSTPEIPLTGIVANSVTLRFDSSWNAEPQLGIVGVSFDGGEPVEILRYDETTPTLINDTISLPVPNPDGAAQMLVHFTYEAGNNWWWAIDNLEVTGNEVSILQQPTSVETLPGDRAEFNVVAHGGALTYQWQKDGEPIAGATEATLVLAGVTAEDAGNYLVLVQSEIGEPLASETVSLRVIGLDDSKIIYSENFDSLPLGPNVDEGLQDANVWTEQGPEGWVMDDSGVPGIDSDDADGDGIPDLDGVTEWAGWSFADRTWWSATAGDQQRSQFTRACGAIFISDGDEWDDATHAPVTDKERLDNVATTGPIALEGVEANSLKMRLDSSWRPYDRQLGIIEAKYDDAEPVEVLRFESSTDSEFYRPDSTNESVTFDLNNPEGASTLQLTFKYLNAGNDWWWAVDNLLIFSGAAPPNILSHPGDLQVNAGESAELQVELDRDNTVGEVSYQWYRRTENGREAIDGATGAVLQLPEAKVEDTGFYSVDVSNQVGSLTSCEAHLVVGPLIIFEQPANLLVSAGDEACFFASAEGAKPFTYQWYRGSGEERVPIAVADNPTANLFELVILSATFEDAGVYSVDVSNNFGVVTSNEVTLQVEPCLILEQPEPTTVTAGGNVTFGVVVDGEEPLEYEWHFRPAGSETSVILEGADSFRLEIPAAELSESGFYSVRVSNAFGECMSSEAKLRVQPASGNSLVYFEGFDDLTLGPNVDEGLANEMAWTRTPPEGWSIDNTRMAGFDSEDADGDGFPDLDGVTEWAGWSFADKDWWVSTAGDQRRSEFSRGQGVVLIADPDEWDDVSHAAGTFNTTLTTAPISLEGVAPGTGVLEFDSSWRPYANQTAVVTASFDGGSAIELARFESNEASPDFKPDDQFIDERYAAALDNPEGAEHVVLTFSLTDAGNDWWWAVDNLRITADRPGQVFAVKTIDRDPATGAVSLTWDSLPGDSYAVETSLDLIQWEIGIEAVASEGLVTSVQTAALPAELRTVYFRVRKE